MKYYVWTTSKCTENNNNNSIGLARVPSETVADILDTFPKNDITCGHKRNFDDTLLYVFTSGTTGGKAKAAIQTDGRVIVFTMGQRITYRLKKDDHIYITLPLYHALGGLSAVSQCLLFGLTITLKEKFSSSQFWSDCARYNCTVRITPNYKYHHHSFDIPLTQKCSWGYSPKFPLSSKIF